MLLKGKAEVVLEKEKVRRYFITRLKEELD